MYDGCFGLNRRPFVSVPQVDYYFPARAIDDARNTLARCIQRGEGAGLVVGPSGTGKTMLCLLLAEQFGQSFLVVMLPSGRLSTRRALFQAILYELGRPYRDMDEGELRLAVMEYLTVGDGGEHGMVLLVDEAHTLPLRLLEEIRLLTNLARGGQPLVRLVLAGNAVLEERFASPKLDSFSQRLGGRCYLEAFSRTETQSYIQSQIDSAGGQGDQLFSEAACQSVFQATGGIPRLINQVCDHALLLAYVAGRTSIEPINIEEAWADLQQLPMPWNGETQSDQDESGVIEFGSLDDSTESSENMPKESTFSVPTLRVTAMEDEADDTEPSHQIHRIERLLAESDDDFQPAGSIRPEIEISFDEAIHPFREKFEHEEIVSDRYAAVAEPVTVAQVCEEATTEAESPSIDATTSTPPEESVEVFSQPEPELEPVFAAVPAMDYDVFDVENPAEEDQPVMVVPPVAPACRHEYRQLFAQLRRG